MRGLEARQHMAGAGAHGGSRRHGRTWGAGRSMAAHVGGGRTQHMAGAGAWQHMEGKSWKIASLTTHTREREQTGSKIKLQTLKAPSQ